MSTLATLLLQLELSEESEQEWPYLSTDIITEPAMVNFNALAISTKRICFNL